MTPSSAEHLARSFQDLLSKSSFYTGPQSQQPAQPSMQQAMQQPPAQQQQAPQPEAAPAAGAPPQQPQAGAPPEMQALMEQLGQALSALEQMGQVVEQHQKMLEAISQEHAALKQQSAELATELKRVRKDNEELARTMPAMLQEMTEQVAENHNEIQGQMAAMHQGMQTAQMAAPQPGGVV